MATVDPLSLTVFVELSLLLLVLFSLLWLVLAVSVALGLVGVSVTVCSEGVGVSDAVEVVAKFAAFAITDLEHVCPGFVRRDLGVVLDVCDC